MEEIPIWSTAFRHGVDEKDIRHALDHVLFSIEEREDFTMLAGWDTTGSHIEVGILDTEDGPVVIHAQRPARRRYLP